MEDKIFNFDNNHYLINIKDESDKTKSINSLINNKFFMLHICCSRYGKILVYNINIIKA